MIDFPIVLSLIAAFVATIMALMVSIFAVASRRRDRDSNQYDIHLQRAELDTYRSMLERQILDLNKRLTSSESMWDSVNHLIGSSQRSRLAEHEGTERRNVNSFLKSMGISMDNIEIDPRLVFLLTPFHEEESNTFRVISDVCRESGLEIQRGDEEYVQGDLMQHILRSLLKARIVIANINGRNPNVFYELGIAQALDKLTIVTSRSLGDTPFDLQSQRIVLYSSDDELRDRLKSALTQSLVHEKSL